MTEFEDSAVAVITGGASGLGAASAHELARLGLRPIIFDRDEALGRERAEALGGDFYAVDVSDEASVEVALATIAKSGRPLRALVNCAGIGSAAKTVSRGQPLSGYAFETVIRVNLFGTFLCASKAAGLMASQPALEPDGQRGVIINTASVAAFDGQVGQVAYAASKAGIAGMTLPMARDLADKGIRVCTLAPGLFLTPLVDTLPAEAKASLASQVPFPSRLGDPNEFASLVAHIVSNPMINAETIRIDGGIRMGPR